jgi:hypothetical protein
MGFPLPIRMLVPNGLDFGRQARHWITIGAWAQAKGFNREGEEVTLIDMAITESPW